MAESVIEATETVFLGLPKCGCFFPEAWEHTGQIHIHNFGLEERFIEEAEAKYNLIDDRSIETILPPIKRTRHKYETGYVVGVGGSTGMPGAPAMACFAALRAGAGIVRLFHPMEMEDEFGQIPIEIIHQGYREHDTKDIFKQMERASAIFLGPGMGNSPSAQALIVDILDKTDKPVVIDADALFIAENRIALSPVMPF